MLTQANSVAIPVLTRILADLFTLDLRTEENLKGTLGTAALYKALMDVRTFGFNDNDPAMSWRRRNWAREGATLLTETTVKSIQESSQSPGLFGKIGDSVNDAASKLPIIGSLVKKPSASGSLRWYGSNVVREIIAAGKNLEETADICWLTGVAGVGAPISMVSSREYLLGYSTDLTVCRRHELLLPARQYSPLGKDTGSCRRLKQ